MSSEIQYKQKTPALIGYGKNWLFFFFGFNAFNPFWNPLLGSFLYHIKPFKNNTLSIYAKDGLS